MTSKQEARRKQIYEFYLNNRSEGKKYTLDYFLAAKIPRQTISDIIKRAVNNLGHEKMSGSGRVAKIMTKTNIKGLKNIFEHRDGVSTRQVARKFKCSLKLYTKIIFFNSFHIYLKIYDSSNFSRIFYVHPLKTLNLNFNKNYKSTF